MSVAATDVIASLRVIDITSCVVIIIVNKASPY